MKITFRLLGTAVLATFLAASVMAQSPRRGPQGGPGGRMDPKQMAEHRVKELKTALNLSSSQEKKILAIYTKAGKEMRAYFQSHRPAGPRSGPGGPGGPSGDFRKHMEAMRAKTDKAINAVLTSAQRKKYKAWEAEHRMHRGGPGGGPRPGAPQRAR